eukprot:scaffold29666_cov106-Isochrysis_galbana.AAC.2
MFLNDPVKKAQASAFLSGEPYVEDYLKQTCASEHVSGRSAVTPPRKPTSQPCRPALFYCPVPTSPLPPCSLPTAPPTKRCPYILTRFPPATTLLSPRNKPTRTAAYHRRLSPSPVTAACHRRPCRSIGTFNTWRASAAGA